VVISLSLSHFPCQQNNTDSLHNSSNKKLKVPTVACRDDYCSDFDEFHSSQMLVNLAFLATPLEVHHALKYLEEGRFPVPGQLGSPGTGVPVVHFRIWRQSIL
jgi:hypothetical protein